MTDLLGKRIGRYRVVDLLGTGGMGQVYAGYDERLDRKVALKCIRADHRPSAEAKARFLREARVLSQLAHPNICRVYDIAEVNGQHFLSMEFIDGEDLASLLKRIGYLPNEKALDIARQLLAGLPAAGPVDEMH